MGLLRKAAVGSLLVGLGAYAVATRQKELKKIQKQLVTKAKKEINQFMKQYAKAAKPAKAVKRASVRAAR